MRVGGRILLVEDHRSMRDAILMVLRSEGYAVEEVGDGDAALAAVRANPPDLVFLDLNIPGTDGAEVLRRIKADPATAHVRVIVVTATGEEGRAEATALGADGYVTKPFGPAALVRTVRRMLGDPPERREP
ncbi:MAG: response regulator [Actinomycetota bacterium]|jgi:two-component system phosphate regulon response regulator PhoB|nr:MAG: response regulator [Actinomycetota bacterium]